MTKAQWAQEEAKLAGEAFANAEQFDAAVAKLAARESTYGVASSLFQDLEKLGEMNQDRGNTQTAANEVQKMVVAEQTANPKLTYDEAWANVKRTEKGKGLIAQMKQPTPQN